MVVPHGGGQRLKVGAPGGPPAASCHTATVVGCRALAYGRRWVVLRGGSLLPPRLCRLSACYLGCRIYGSRLGVCDPPEGPPRGLYEPKTSGWHLTPARTGLRASDYSLQLCEENKLHPSRYVRLHIMLPFLRMCHPALITSSFFSIPPSPLHRRCDLPSPSSTAVEAVGGGSRGGRLLAPVSHTLFPPSLEPGVDILLRSWGALAVWAAATTRRRQMVPSIGRKYSVNIRKRTRCTNVRG